MTSSEPGPVGRTIRVKLEEAFAPTLLSVRDESHLHAGHAGHDERGESHFSVAMQSAAFVGKSRVERQRLVYSVLAAELKERVHALRLSLLAPGEEGRA